MLTEAEVKKFIDGDTGKLMYQPREPGCYLQDYNAMFNRKAMRKLAGAGMHMDNMAEMAAFGFTAAEEASCWVINEAAKQFIQHTTLPSDALAEWRLPYPRMCIEWCASYEPEKAQKHKFDKDDLIVPALERLMFVCETSAMEVFQEGDNYQRTAFDGFYLVSAFRQPFPGLREGNPSMPWVLNPIALVVPYTGLNDLSDWAGVSDDGQLLLQTDTEFLHMDDPTPSLTLPTPVPSTRSLGSIWDELANKGALQQGIRDMIEEVHMLLGLLAMMRCENLPVKEISPSALKNRQLKSRKQPPIPTYRTLHLSDHTINPNMVGGPGHDGEKSAHWRRGHIRNQKTAMGTVRKWIAPVLVRADKLADGDMPKPTTAVT